MNRLILYVMIAISFYPLWATAAVRGKHAMYAGGTIGDLAVGKKGGLDFSGEVDFVFRPHDEHIPFLRIPFAQITTVEYGQHAGRRVRVALLGGGIPALLSHKRKHFVTIYFPDSQGKEQAAIFELGKKIVREVLTVLRVKTGKEIEFQSEDAKRNLGHP